MSAKKATPAEIELPDIDKLLGSFPQLALDPATAGLNLATMVVWLIGKIIDTIPAEQHAENWDRLNEVLNRIPSISAKITP